MGIFEAVKAGNAAAVHQLLRRTGGAGLGDSEGNTPLHFAGSPEIARLILRFGGHPNARNALGEAPLHLCENVSLAVLLIECGANPDLQDFSGRAARNQFAASAALAGGARGAYMRLTNDARSRPGFSMVRVSTSFADALGIVPGALSDEDLSGAWDGVTAGGAA